MRRAGNVICRENERKELTGLVLPARATEYSELATAGVAERFWSHVRIGEGCWEWLGKRNPRGYGRVRISGREQLAHRIAWQLTHGKIPPGKVVLHVCDHPWCVRPDHLRLGTQAENVRDMFRKGRNVNVRGERHPAAKLTQEQVMSIRMRCANGEGRRKIAREYGVSSTNVRHILKGRIWAWLKA